MIVNSIRYLINSRGSQMIIEDLDSIIRYVKDELDEEMDKTDRDLAFCRDIIDNNNFLKNFYCDQQSNILPNITVSINKDIIFFLNNDGDVIYTTNINTYENKDTPR